MKKYRFILVLSLLWLQILPCFGQETIKVAFMPIQSGFFEVEEKGGYAGYTYDYLMEIAAYTGWEYEFVVVDEGWYSYSKAKEMLLNGELDLIGPMFPSDFQADSFVYGENHNGITRHVLCTSPRSNLNADNYFLTDGLLIALVEGAQEANDAFFSLVSLYDLNISSIYVDSESEAIRLLEENQVDLVMSLDMSADFEDLICLETIHPAPFYFVSSQENAHLIQELDQAVEKLNQAESGIFQRLKEEYFQFRHEGDIELTQEQTAQLNEDGGLTVGFYKDLAPYQSYDEKTQTGTGISVEILEHISAILNVPFRYVWCDTYDELAEKIATEEIDVIASLPIDYNLTSRFQVVLSRPYISSGVVWLHQENEKEMVEHYYHFVADNIPQIQDEDLHKVENIYDIMLELSKTGSISLFCDPYIAQYNLQKLGIQNVDMQTLSDVSSHLVFGIGSHLDSDIVGLFNHAVLHLDIFEVDEIIYRNVVDTGLISLEAFIQEHVTSIILSIVAIFAAVIGALLYHSYKLRNLSRRDGLTKLYNSGYFHHYAEEKAGKLGNGVLILFDIDYFKQVNDNFGHQTGDEVIRRVAENVDKLFSYHGIVARLGGDEFVVLLTVDTDQKELDEKCQLLLLLLEKAVKGIPISLSIGGIVFRDPTPYKVLYRLADENLYQVKEAGRNGYRFSCKI